MVCTLTFSRCNSGIIKAMILSLESVLSTLFFETSTTPSVNKIKLRWCWATGVFQSSIETCKVFSMSVKTPREWICCTCDLACFFQASLTSPNGASSRVFSANSQMPAWVFTGSKSMSKLMAGIRRLSGSFFFILPETSISMRISFIGAVTTFSAEYSTFGRAINKKMLNLVILVI